MILSEQTSELTMEVTTPLVMLRNLTRKMSSDYPNGEESYDGDELYDIPSAIVTLLVVAYITVSLTAATGNAMVLYVIIRSRRLRSVTNFFIANLATADIIIAVFAIPFQFQAALLQRWVLPLFMCSFCPSVQVVSLNVSIFTLVAISIDRYRAVMNPLEAHNNSKLRTKLIIGFIWVFALVLAIPTFMGLKVQYIKEPSTGLMTKPFCSMIGLDNEIWKVYNHGLVALQYFVPLVIISYSYLSMGARLCNESGLPAEARSNSDRVVKNRKKVIKMLLIVITLFAICWLPFQMYNVLQEIYPAINEYRYINITWFGFHLLAMSNSCYNPLIYYLYSERYNYELRRHFGCLFCGLCCNAEDGPSSSMPADNNSTTAPPAAQAQLINNPLNHTQTEILAKATNRSLGSTRSLIAVNAPKLNSPRRELIVKASMLNDGQVSVSLEPVSTDCSSTQNESDMNSTPVRNGCAKDNSNENQQIDTTSV